MVFKNRTTKQFEYFLQGIRFYSLEKVKKSWGGRNLIFIKKNLSYKIRKDLSESDELKEVFSLKILYKSSSNTLPSCCYKLPKGDNDIFSTFLKQF